jgi:serine/threonine protein kinase
MTRCPPVERLQTLLTDDPSGPDSDLLASHVQHCTRCQQQLEKLTSVANRPADGSGVAQGTKPTDEYEPNTGFLAQLQQSYGLLKALPPETDEGRDTPCQDSRRRRAADEEPLPRVVGHEILEEIGRGGAGVVYKARQISLGRLVALKMLLDGSHAARDELARFRREAAAIARLRHANIVQIYEVGTQDGRPFFSMEYVAAGSLAQYLAGTPQDSRSAAQLVGTLAEAIHAAHQQGIVHRDLKPANILLQKVCTTEDTEDTEKRSGGEAGAVPLRSSVSAVVKNCVPKITDFGLAKIVQRRALGGEGESEREPLTIAAQARTRTGAILGTPNYMAPEQAQANATAIGPAADVYALGAILYDRRKHCWKKQLVCVGS